MCNNCDRLCDLLRAFRNESGFEGYELPFEGMLINEAQLASELSTCLQFTDSELARVRELVDLHLAVRLVRLAQRMTNAAVTLKNEALVRSAIVAISLDQDLLDDRELYRTGVLILDCCRRLGLSAEMLYSTCLTLATENRRALLARQMTTAPDYMRSLRAMYFGVVQSNGEFKYIDQMFSSSVFDKAAVNRVIAHLSRNENSKDVDN